MAKNATQSTLRKTGMEGIVDTNSTFAEIVRKVQETSEEQRPSEAAAATEIGCRIKQLPERLRDKGAQVAARMNPTNAPLRELLPEGVIAPQHLILLTTKYWGSTPREFTVSFMESTPADLRARILSHMNAWSLWANKTFVETSGTGDVRISRGSGGYYSYLGTDVSLIPSHMQTMNLEGFTMSHSESEFLRVIRHETGHTMGFPHEHLRRELVSRLDPVKAYAYFLATQGWDKATVDAQVLTPLDESSIFGTPPDEDSIMCYQLPGQITYDGQPIRGGTNINATDYAFAAIVYPKVGFAMPAGAQARAPQEDWDPSLDVDVPAY
jgi:hypothetical protein